MAIELEERVCYSQGIRMGSTGTAKESDKVLKGYFLGKRGRDGLREDEREA